MKEALDRVGEETSGILQRAHETAEEITGAARLEAEQRVAAADQAASALRDEAEEHARKLAADTEALWQERCMLIDDMRTLAEGLLAGADAAAERLRKPDVAASEPVDVAPDPPPADASAAEREVEERPPAEVADEVADAEEPARDDGPASAGAPIDWEPDSGASEPIIRRTDNPPTEQFDPLAHEDEADVENLRAMEFRRRWST